MNNNPGQTSDMFLFWCVMNVKIMSFLDLPCSFHLHDLDYGGYSIWWSNS
jgi:hypothetical protein